MKPLYTHLAAALLALLSQYSLQGQQYTFSTAGASGRFGPTQTQVDNAYQGTSLDGQVAISTPGIQQWTVPTTGTYTISAAGAEGGDGTNSADTYPGLGAQLSGSFELEAGTVLYVLVGQRGGDAQPAQGSCSAVANRGGGGGGGSFVTLADYTPLLVAGGGNGDSFNTWTTDGPDGQVSNTGTGGGAAGRGGGGGGLVGNGAGTGGGLSMMNGGQGGLRVECNKGDGGFGGGGGARHEGGGGGGYSGGSVVPTANFNASYPSYGAGSFNSGSDQSNLAGIHSGDGFVQISLEAQASITLVDPIQCYGGATGALKAEYTGGTPPYTYLWSNGSTAQVAGALSAGDYQVTVTDANAIEVSASFELGQPDPISITFESSPSSTCAPQGDGSIAATAAGGLAPYSFEWSQGDTGANLSNLSAGTYSATATDANGCISPPQDSEVLVNDLTMPIALAQDVALFLDAEGTATLSATALDAGSTDDCALGTIAVLNPSFSCQQPGFAYEQTATLQVADQAGNLASDQAAVLLIDSIAPLAKGKDITLLLDSDGLAQLNPDAADNGSTDNCIIDKFEVSKSNFSCEDLGSQTIAFRAIDLSGNSSTDSISVVVVDQLAPSATIQPVSLALNAESEATLSVGDLDYQAMDNCTVAEVGLSRSSFSCEDLGSAEVFLVLTDASGNVAQVPVPLTISDNTAPEAVAQPFVVELGTDGTALLSSEQVASLVDAGSSDNCSILPGSHQLSQMSFSCEDLGAYSLTYSLSDQSLNSSSTSATVQVVDLLAPEVVVQDITVPLGADGQAILDPLNADAGSVDNCGIVSRELSQSLFTCQDLGSHEVTLEASDFSGNVASATFTVTVVDTEAPTAAFENNHTVYLDQDGSVAVNADMVLAQYADNCQVAAVTLSSSAFDCNEVGMQSLSVIVEDANGNLTQVDGQITVADTLKPVFTLNSISLTLDEEGVAHLNQELLLPYASDNCGILEVAVEDETFTCNESGQATTQVLVFDIHGNFVQQNLEVFIEDTEAPMISSIEPITLYLDDSGQAILDADAVPAAISENCGIAARSLEQSTYDCSDLGTGTNTLLVSDFGGNETFASFEVTVADTTAPSFSCQAAVEACAGVLNIPAPALGDNCGATAQLISGPENGSTVAPGTYERVFTAADAAGNTAMCVQQLLVSAAPEVDLGADMAVSSGTTVPLSAAVSQEASYLWSTGDTTASIEVLVTQTSLISVTVNTANGCSVSDEILINVVLGTQSVSASELGIAVYPNPATDQLHLQWNTDTRNSAVQLSMYDVQGRMVIQRLIPSLLQGQIITQPIHHLEPGMYVLTLSGQQLQAIQQVIIK